MLEVKNLTTVFYKDGTAVTAVDDVSFTVQKGEILGILGESGSGKSTVANSIMQLVPPPGKIISGEILFNGQDILKLSEHEMIKIRGAKIAMVFQDPFTSLNPVLTVGEQIVEAIRLHQGLNKNEAWQRAIEMLETVRINGAAERIRDYPHQFSGGMRQRVMLAMALSCQPELLLADEPTTALDVTIQAEIIKLIKELQQKFNLSVIYITHNFGIIRALCQRVIVMHGGKVVEVGTVSQIISAPKEEYTRNLVNCLQVLKS
jgi:ABC-type dipeptide/oligopeptide/nickel transport system ATPase component